MLLISFELYLSNINRDAFSSNTPVALPTSSQNFGWSRISAGFGEKAGFRPEPDIQFLMYSRNKKLSYRRDGTRRRALSIH